MRFRTVVARFLGKAAHWMQRSGFSVFAGAQGGRLVMDWISRILSADQEIKGNLYLLRGRGRELGRNNPIAKSYLTMRATNIVGKDGILYRAMVRNNDGKLAADINRKIERAFKDWCRKGNCTVDGKLSFRAVQDLAVRTEAQDGEFFLRMVRGFDNPYGFALQLIDADQVDHLYSRMRGGNAGEEVRGDSGNNEIRMGVEVDQWGRPVAYWINPGHPSDIGGSLMRDRVPANQIVHLYDPSRVNQTRGVTAFHAIMFILKMLEGYLESAIVAARTAAAKFGWLEYTDASGFTEPMANPDGSLKSFRMEANPGVLETIPPGMKYVEANANHPGGVFGPFLMWCLRLVATGLDVNYNELANDWVGVSYSSMRSALLSVRAKWRREQTRVSEDLLDPVFRAWLPMAMLAGQAGKNPLKLDSRDQEKFLDGCWLFPGWGWVDPRNDTQSAILEIGAKLSSRGMILADQGVEFEQVIEESAEEREFAKLHGFDLKDDLPGKVATNDNPDEGEDDGEDTEDGTTKKPSAKEEAA
jgi:lambda family phage portal protein